MAYFQLLSGRGVSHCNLDKNRNLLLGTDSMWFYVIKKKIYIGSDGQNLGLIYL